MKIGIITFHWAANCGAMLQAYALQTYISQIDRGGQVQVINYYPKRFNKSLLRCFTTRHPSIIKNNLRELRKERTLGGFRGEMLNLTKRYYSTAELNRECVGFDALVCGSDQIWNPDFTEHGEGGLTLAYFLGFGRKDAKRISYAASFGCSEYPQSLMDELIPSLHAFDALSVREQSGVEILKKAGFGNAELVLDPVFLLDKSVYMSIIDSTPRKVPNGKKAVYVLRKDSKQLIGNFAERLKTARDSFSDISGFGVADWLRGIYDSDCLITNSFHGTAMSLILHKDFFVVLESGSLASMNDRIATLLEKAGLTNRIISEDQETGSENEPIDWAAVDARLRKYRDSSREYIKSAIKGDKQ